ncbi:hypothetical protein H2198_006768 [Neophaeococcomyces mojaviensis]|uniref:Uncharacterized protein n=1 Tax=Neophaeococcomyces mojaviensis TaxID=3383035 RepID=A0ACC3A216_9EURO|nr:hypothetical protein H2198_006768 [Knufia sp. JES_112]
MYRYHRQEEETYLLTEEDDSDSQTTVSSASDADGVGESDEDFIELDSEVWDSADDYQDHGVQSESEGSSEHWKDEEEDEEASEVYDNDPIDVLNLLDETSRHELSMANLNAVLCSLELNRNMVASHTRAGNSEAEAEASETQDR